MDPSQKLEACFNQALDLEGDAREAFLVQLGEPESSFVLQLRKMIEEFEAMDDVFENPAIPNGFLGGFSENDTLSDGGFLQGLGEMSRDVMPESIGSYKVLEKIGEGGMGIVYLVEQEVPRRKLALKLLTQHRATTERRARFESEYQTLAMMRHPNIANLHEAGLSEHGDIYFTMEYVEGWTITDYCREKGLSLPDRLRLFMQACDGVMHAHQKSILHRDLKPSNILVTEVSGKPLVKIIDFGIAKAMDTFETRDFETRVGALVGTLEFMSYEQLMGLDVDTRADVFGLGVVLYEMLTGKLPRRFQKGDDSSAEAILKYYRDAEITRPSRLLSAIKEADYFSEQGIERSGAYIKMLSQDLDWIIIKSLEREVGRRYQSPLTFKEDLERFLAQEPVRARPPGVGYLVGKFLRRNVLAVSFASLIGLGIMIGFVLLARSNRRLEAANKLVVENMRVASENMQRYKTTSNFLQDVLAAPDPRRQGVQARVIDVLDSAEGRLQKLSELGEDAEELQIDIRMILGKTYMGLMQYDTAERHLSQALELARKNLGSQEDTALRIEVALYRTWIGQHRFKEALEPLRTIYKNLVETRGQKDESTIAVLKDIANCYKGLNDYAKALSLLEDALKFQQDLGVPAPDLAETYCLQGDAYRRRGEYMYANGSYGRAYALQRDFFGAEHEETLRTYLQFQEIGFEFNPDSVKEADVREVLNGIEYMTGAYPLNGILLMVRIWEHKQTLWAHHDEIQKYINTYTQDGDVPYQLLLALGFSYKGLGDEVMAQNLFRDLWMMRKPLMTRTLGDAGISLRAHIYGEPDCHFGYSYGHAFLNMQYKGQAHRTLELSLAQAEVASLLYRCGEKKRASQIICRIEMMTRSKSQRRAFFKAFYRRLDVLGLQEWRASLEAQR